MIERIKIDGVYDERTTRLLEELSVSDIGFDFRPKSFNFLQGHLFISILEKTYSEAKRYFLNFADEKKFMIEKCLSDLKDSKIGLRENICLEFSDINEPAYYDQFKRPFFWHYNSDGNPKRVIQESKNLKGIVLSHSHFEEYVSGGNSFSFCQNLLQMLASRDGGLNLELILSLDWGIKLVPSIIDMLDIEVVSFSINRKIEVCYRNLNSTKLKENLSRIRTF